MAVVWNKVTPFSKFLALVLFVLLPFGGFWLGFHYGDVAGQGTAGSLIASSTLQGVTTPGSISGGSTAGLNPYYTNPAEWQTDSNTAGGFSFAYPLDFPVQDNYKPAPSTDWRLNAGAPGIQYTTLTIPSAFEPDTNFADATLTVGASGNQAAVAQCLQADADETGPGFSTSTTAINGIQFTVFKSTGVGAGNTYDTTSYRTLHAGECYAVEYTIHSGQILNYPASYGLTPFNEAQVSQVLDSIVGTFKFL